PQPPVRHPPARHRPRHRRRGLARRRTAAGGHEPRADRGHAALLRPHGLRRPGPHGRPARRLHALPGGLAQPVGRGRPGPRGRRDRAGRRLRRGGPAHRGVPRPRGGRVRPLRLAPPRRGLSGGRVRPAPARHALPDSRTGVVSAVTEARPGPADGGPGTCLDNTSTRGRFRPRTPAPVRSLGLRALSVGSLLLLWWAVARAEIWPPVILPSPQAVWEKAVATTTEGFSGHTLPEHLWVSMRRILVGSGYGTLGGVLLGLLIGLAPAVRALLGPFISFVRTLPPLAYLRLLVIWFGINEEPKIWLLIIASLPPVAVATADAVRNVEIGRAHV